MTVLINRAIRMSELLKTPRSFFWESLERFRVPTREIVAHGPHMIRTHTAAA